MSAPAQPTRAELLERLRKSSKDAVVLEEMQRLGFWPAGTAQPSVEAALIQREVELQKTLDALRAQLGTRADPESALKQMRKERMAAARAKREANAQAREQRRHENALRWHEQSGKQISYLGDGVSTGLYPDRAAQRPERLAQHQLPPLASPLELAQAMGIHLAELKFLTFHREVARTHHYRRFRIAKKSGGERTISAPMPRLKRAQYWVLDNVLAKVPCHPAAHGFVPGRSIVSNAAPHCGQAVVANLDLKDFFPSIAFPRIKGVFRGLGYGEDVATVLALLCSENPSDELAVDGETFFVGGKGRDRVLPQGAPTSPMLTNVLCRKLDRRLAGLAKRFGFAYTRYADDLTLSAPKDAADSIGRLLRQVHHVLRDEGFTPHPDKQRVMRAGTRQEVTGVVVNQRPSVSREQRRRLRAALHRAQASGIEQAKWEGAPAGREQLLGYAQFVSSVNASQGKTLLAKARALPTPSRAASRPGSSEAFRQRAAQGAAPVRPNGAAWWEPRPVAAPVLQLTAEQIRVARQEKRAEQRAEKRAQAPGAAPAASARPTDTARAAQLERAVQAVRTVEAAREARAAQAGTSAPITPPKMPLSGVRFAFQLILVLWLSIRAGSALAFMGGTAWIAWSLVQRKQGWPRFLIGFAVVMVASAVIQSLF